MDDDAGFDAFYAAHATAVARHVFLLTASRARAARVTRRAFERAWRDWSKVGRLDDPGAWVRATASDLALSGLRELGCRAWRYVPHRDRVGPAVPALPGEAEPAEDPALTRTAQLKSLPGRAARSAGRHTLVVYRRRRDALREDWADHDAPDVPDTPEDEDDGPGEAGDGPRPLRRAGEAAVRGGRAAARRVRGLVTAGPLGNLTVRRRPAGPDDDPGTGTARTRRKARRNTRPGGTTPSTSHPPTGRGDSGGDSPRGATAPGGDEESAVCGSAGPGRPEAETSAETSAETTADPGVRYASRTEPRSDPVAGPPAGAQAGSPAGRATATGDGAAPGAPAVPAPDGADGDHSPPADSAPARPAGRRRGRAKRRGGRHARASHAGGTSARARTTAPPAEESGSRTAPDGTRTSPDEGPATGPDERTEPSATPAPPQSPPPPSSRPPRGPAGTAAPADRSGRPPMSAGPPAGPGEDRENGGDGDEDEEHDEDRRNDAEDTQEAKDGEDAEDAEDAQDADRVPPPAREDDVAVLRALHGMSARRRRAVVLHLYAGLRMEEVAAETEATRVTTRARLARAREILAAGAPAVAGPDPESPHGEAALRAAMADLARRYQPELPRPEAVRERARTRTKVLVASVAVALLALLGGSVYGLVDPGRLGDRRAEVQRSLAAERARGTVVDAPAPVTQAPPPGLVPGELWNWATETAGPGSEGFSVGRTGVRAAIVPEGGRERVRLRGWSSRDGGTFLAVSPEEAPEGFVPVPQLRLVPLAPDVVADGGVEELLRRLRLAQLSDAVFELRYDANAQVNRITRISP